jgi:hypothetical protein
LRPSTWKNWTSNQLLQRFPLWSQVHLPASPVRLPVSQVRLPLSQLPPHAL